MALTKQQLLQKEKKITGGCSNGFTWDWYHYMIHKENIVQKIIPLSEEKRLVGVLKFYENYVRGTRQKVNIPTLSVSIDTIENYGRKSNEKSNYEIWHIDYKEKKQFPEKSVPKKSMKVLQELTKEITDELLYSLAGLPFNEEQPEESFSLLELIDTELNQGTYKLSSITL